MLGGNIVFQPCMSKKSKIVKHVVKDSAPTPTVLQQTNQVMLLHVSSSHSIFESDVNMKLDDNVNNEKMCPERTCFTCLQIRCKEEIQLKKECMYI